VKVPDESVFSCPKEDTCPIWPYVDALPKSWYHEGVHYCLEEGLMIGFGNGIFKPSADTSRSMVAMILYRIEGCPTGSIDLTFPDVASDSWYGDAVAWAASEGYILGHENGTFAPSEAITREQLATILWRYVGSPQVSQRSLDFTDADQASSYAVEALLWANEIGILKGYPNGSLNPKGYATRAEAAHIVMDFVQILSRENG
jgi:hypothetical protein